LYTIINYVEILLNNRKNLVNNALQWLLNKLYKSLMNK